MFSFLCKLPYSGPITVRKHFRECATGGDVLSYYVMTAKRPMAVSKNQGTQYGPHLDPDSTAVGRHAAVESGEGDATSGTGADTEACPQTAAAKNNSLRVQSTQIQGT